MANKYTVTHEIPIPVHQEGQTFVMPVLEEVLLVEKRLRLKEEIRITARSKQRPVSQSVVLRTENVSIEEFDDQAEFARKPSSE